MKKTALLVTTFLLGFSLLLFGGCRHAQGGKEAHLDFVIDYLDAVLDLDATQQAQLDGIKQELLTELEGLEASRKEMRPMLREQLAAAQIDTAVVKQAIADHRRQLDRIAELAVDRLAEFHATLTPEQRQKLIERLDKMEKRHSCPLSE